MAEAVLTIEPSINNNLIPFEETPISALQPKTRQALSIYLNPIKLLSSENGQPRDWRGVFHLSGIDNYYWDLLTSKQDHIDELLKIWSKDKLCNANFAVLQNIFGVIDRWDVFDDTQELLGN